MSWILLATVLLLALFFGVFKGKFKKTKPVIEVIADENQVRSLDLKPGEFVRMEPDNERKEVNVYTTRSETGDKLGAINNNFIFRNVIKDNITARIDSITKDRIMLEIIRTI